MEQLAFDFSAPAPALAPAARHEDGRRARAMRGSVSHQAGLAAEYRIAQDYERRGYRLAARRWRGRSGEIDLVFHDGEGLVFVEVKKSRTFDRALTALRPRQIRRLFLAAEEFAGTQPKGSLTPMRLDVALVDGMGFTKVIENAFA